nr:site-2 protease family protein [Pyrococcus sp. ST04]
MGATIWKESESVEVGPFQVIWRTKKFLNFIDRVGRNHERFWKVYGDIGIVVGFIGMAFIVFYLGKQALKILQPKGAVTPSVQLVIPGVTIPLWYGLVGLAILVIVHELSHGFVARAERIPLKSVGLLLFVVIPGAFVEPDEEKLNKAPLISRLRVFGAGSLANIVVALLAVMVVNAIGLAFEENGVEVKGVIENSPAYGVLEPGDVIIGINGEHIKTFEEFVKIMNQTKPGEVITLTILRHGNSEEVKIKLAEHPERPGKGFIGIYPAPHLVSKIGFDKPLMVLFFTFYWIYVLNLGVGLMNLLPLYPLDGGRMLMDSLKELWPRFGKHVGYSIMAISLLLLVINIIPAIRGLVG